MSIQLGGRTIERVWVIDDDPEARQGLAYAVEDTQAEVRLRTERISDDAEFLRSIDRQSDAVLSDYHLRKRNYSSLNGDHLVASCYRAGVPAMLCTTFTDAPLSISKSELRYIPAFFSTSNPTPEQIIGGLATCAEEIAGNFVSERRPWRNQVEVVDEDTEHDCLYVIVPGWSLKKKVMLYKRDVPKFVKYSSSERSFYYAQVNSGAEDASGLYFNGWERG